MGLNLKKIKNQSNKESKMKHIYLDTDYGRDLTANIVNYIFNLKKGK